MSALRWLEHWYTEQCNGVWMHSSTHSYSVALVLPSSRLPRLDAGGSAV
jgi:hypothetical protein